MRLRIFSAIIPCAFLLACEHDSGRRAQTPQQAQTPGYYYPGPGQPYPPPPQPYPGAPSPYGPSPQGFPPNQPAPSTPPLAPPAQPAPSQPVTPAWLPPVPFDPINDIQLAFLRNQAQIVMQELVSALAAQHKQRVQAVPLGIDDTVGEVNAFASCTNGKALMAISDGLLEIQANLAQSRANDEIFGTRKVDEYIAFMARNQRPKHPIVKPPAGFYDLAQKTEGRKVLRQHQLLDEQLGFVLGHELAHHYLGHLPCTGSGAVNAADLARALSNAIPIFNQPNELGADIAGTNNLLSAGAKRKFYRWTESGALLTMQFFSGIDRLSSVDILFGFERSHPPPLIRTPVIQQAASTWRATGGAGFPILGF